MQIDTKYFGEVEINEADQVVFKQGLPGFLDEKAFILLNFDQQAIFQVLQSTQTPGLAFIVVDPFKFVSDYQLELDDQMVEHLEINEEKDVLIMSIVTLNDAVKTSTANLKAPIVINQVKGLAKQYIQPASDYTTKELIFTGLREKGEG